MWWVLLYLLYSCVHAEWPPSTCDKVVLKNENTIKLTPVLARRQESSCSCKEPWSVDAPLYIHMERVPQKQHAMANKSLMGIRFRDVDSEAFHMVVDNRRLKVTGAFEGIFDCPGRFIASPFWVRVRLNTMVNKTSVSISYSSGQTFVPCGRFVLDRVPTSVWTDMHARTETGMVQKILQMQQTIPEISETIPDTAMHKRIESLNRLLASTQKRVETMEQTMAGLGNLVQDLQDVFDIEELKLSVSNTSSRMHFGFIALFTIIGIGICILVRYRPKERIHLL